MAPQWSSPTAWTSQWRGLAAGIVLTACFIRVVQHEPPASRSAPGLDEGGSLARADAIHKEAMQAHGQLLDAWTADGKGDMLLQELWELFGATFPCIEKERYGDALDGGKWVCSAHAVLSPDPCWVFSLGSNGQTDFEEAIRSRYPHCKLHVYDPTISVEVAEQVAAKTQATVHRTWIVSEEGLQSHQTAQVAKDSDAQQYTTLAREMEQISATWLNVLKVDIEGSEWQMFEEFFKTNATIPFSEILVELHAGAIPGDYQHWGSDIRQQIRYFFDRLAMQGYRVANHELNLRCAIPGFALSCFQYCEFTLVKTDGNGHLVLGQQ